MGKRASLLKAWKEHEPDLQAFSTLGEKEQFFRKRTTNNKWHHRKRYQPVQHLDYQNWQYSPPAPLETAILFCFKGNFFDFLFNCYFRKYPLAFTLLGNFSTDSFLKVLKTIRCILQGGWIVDASHTKAFVNSKFLIFIPLSFISH